MWKHFPHVKVEQQHTDGLPNHKKPWLVHYLLKYIGCTKVQLILEVEPMCSKRHTYILVGWIMLTDFVEHSLLFKNQR